MPKKIKSDPKPGREMRIRQKKSEKEEEYCAAKPKCTDPVGVAVRKQFRLIPLNKVFSRKNSLPVIFLHSTEISF